jgi:hypothetical protein
MNVLHGAHSNGKPSLKVNPAMFEAMWFAFIQQQAEADAIQTDSLSK